MELSPWELCTALFKRLISAIPNKLSVIAVAYINVKPEGDKNVFYVVTICDSCKIWGLFKD